MTATFSDFVERDGCARLALVLLLLTSVGCMTYTWGYYEGYHNGTYSTLLLIPPGHAGLNSSTHNTSSLRHPPKPPPLTYKSVQEALPNSRSKSLPGSDDEDVQLLGGRTEDHQGGSRGHAEHGAADAQGGGEKEAAAAAAADGGGDHVTAAAMQRGAQHGSTTMQHGSAHDAVAMQHGGGEALVDDSDDVRLDADVSMVKVDASRRMRLAF